jgi:hypothetical protein
MYKLTAFLAVGFATLLLTGKQARADLDGLIFDTTVSVGGQADVDGLLTFGDGTFTFASDLVILAEGSYTVTNGGGAFTVIRGTWVADVELGTEYEFTAIVIDPKQYPGRLGERARERNTPARINGFSGRGRGGLSFSGEESLLIPELP